MESPDNHRQGDHSGTAKGLFENPVEYRHHDEHYQSIERQDQRKQWGSGAYYQPVIRVALGAVFTALIMFLPIHIWGMIGIVVGGLLRCARSGSLRFGWRRHLRHNPFGYEVARGRNQRDYADQTCRPPDSSSEWGWRLACTI